MDSAKKTSKDSRPPVATNRKALRDYFVLERIEVGVVLRGAEVKSIREGRFSLNEAFSRIDDGEAVLCDFHIQPYEHARADGYDPVRPKKLLLHRREIDRLIGETSVKGMALIPLKLYFHRGRVKVELGLCRGKHVGDKRETIRRRTAEREAERAIAARTRRK